MAVRPDWRNGVGVNRWRAFRLGVVLAPLAAAGLLTAPAPATAHTVRSEMSLQSLNGRLLAAVNHFRVAHHLVPLHESSALDSSAREHSFQMGKLGYFGHSSANGTVFWRRIQHYYSSRNRSYWSVGENLLWAAPSVGAGRAMRMWIASPEHLRNLLTSQWRQIGISAVHVVRAPGVFHGLAVTIITTDFGVRR
jgi:uncharacterized protein YkwD